MHLLRCLWFFTAHYDIVVNIEHIPGESNCAADHLSRNRVQSFFLSVPLTSLLPPPLPPKLMELAMGSNPDWTSPPSGYCSVLLSTRLGTLNSKVLPNWPKMISFLLQCSCKTPTTRLLLTFVSQLAREGLAHQSIKRYLSAVRNLHITAGLHEEFSKELTPKLEMVLRGIKSRQ